jgi:hypothetical protein
MMFENGGDGEEEIPLSLILESVFFPRLFFLETPARLKGWQARSAGHCFSPALRLAYSSQSV